MRDIPGYSGYAVTEDGKVWSHISQRWLSTSSTPRGHLQVNLTVEGKTRSAYVHHLVLFAYTGPRPEGLLGLHVDDDKSNNDWSNLIWDTQLENMLHAKQNGLIGKHPSRQFSDDDIRSIRLRHREGETPGSIANKLGCSHMVIRHILKGHTYKEVL